MRHLKVLITSSYYWPEGAGTAPYLTGLAEYLSGRGHTVVVGDDLPALSGVALVGERAAHGSEVRAGVTIRRRAHFVPRRQSAAQRALYEATLLASGLTALPLRRRPDVVIGTCPSLAGGLLARVASIAYRVPYGLIFQDLMGLAARQSGVAGGDRVASVVRQHGAGDRAARRGGGDHRRGLSRVLRGGGRGAGARSSACATGRGGSSRGDARADARATRLAARTSWSACTAATWAKSRVSAISSTPPRSCEGERIRIVLAGDGNDRARLQAEASRRGLADVEFMPMQGPGRWEELMQASDVLLVNQRASVADMSLPSKLTSYFPAARPVVASVSPDSETAREIEAAEAGYVVPPEDPAALRDVLVSLRRDPSAATAFGDSVRRYAETYLSGEASLERHEAVRARRRIRLCPAGAGRAGRRRAPVAARYRSVGERCRREGAQRLFSPCAATSRSPRVGAKGEPARMMVIGGRGQPI